MASEVRSSYQPQTAKAFGLTIPPSVAGSSGPGHRVINRSAFLCGLTLGALAVPPDAEAADCDDSKSSRPLARRKG